MAIAHAALFFPENTYQVQDTLTQEAALYLALAQYRFEKYKKNDLKPLLLMIQEGKLPALSHLAQAHFLVSDLINLPACDMGPEQMANVVEQLAKTHGGEFKQWVGEQLVQDNFPAIHAVGRASQTEPRLLSLTWGNERNPHVTLVGKGVCYDTGGLNLKSAYGMRIMKKDMGGASHAIGLAQWIMARKLPIRLHLLIPAVENAVGPKAYRPGDILKMRNGLTVEIDNTDADGRLILSDTLAKACDDQPDLLIDFATLTSSARVSVGTEISALFTNNDQLAAALIDASTKTADPIWRMPLFAPYERLLESNVADMVNCSDSPYAGAIVASLFLQRFLSKPIPWAHFDIMACSEQSKPGKHEGGEGMGFRTVAAYLLRTYSPF